MLSSGAVTDNIFSRYGLAGVNVPFITSVWVCLHATVEENEESKDFLMKIVRGRMEEHIVH